MDDDLEFLVDVPQVTVGDYHRTSRVIGTGLFQFAHRVLYVTPADDRVSFKNAAGFHPPIFMKKLADDLILFDNPPHGRGVRLIAHFCDRKLVQLARVIPQWAQKKFGKEFAKWVTASS